MLKEEVGDLFELDNSWCLAHCVGEDFIMGKGIAVEFKKRYGHQDWLIKNSKGIGTALLLKKYMTKERDIFHLITKKYSKYSKPTYASIKEALVDMFAQANTHNIKKIAMPKIGCGLDGKEWCNVKKIIEEIMPKDFNILIKSLEVIN
jgi:O-acetyl-ADP-ribose deacetylase (regulator of RNase III)